MAPIGRTGACTSGGLTDATTTHPMGDQMTETTIAISALPDWLQTALRDVGYRRAAIGVCVRDSVSIQGFSGAGRRAFAILCDLYAAPVKTTALFGSWGGPSMFSNSPVDVQREPVALHAGSVVVTGDTLSGGGAWAQVNVCAATLATWLAGSPGELGATMMVAADAAGSGRDADATALVARALTDASSDLSDLDRRVLYCYGALKSGAYRTDALAKVAKRVGRSAEQLIASLVERGYLKRATNGATQITTKGRAARRHTGASEVW